MWLRQSPCSGQPISRLQGQGKLKRAPIDDRATMKALAEPVVIRYAKEIGAEALLTAINAAQ